MINTLPNGEYGDNNLESKQEQVKKFTEALREEVASREKTKTSGF